jgi:hypothetical protein
MKAKKDLHVASPVLAETRRSDTDEKFVKNFSALVILAYVHNFYIVRS